MRDVLTEMRLNHTLFQLGRVPRGYGDAAPPIFPRRPNPFFKPERAQESRDEPNGTATPEAGTREHEG